MVDFKDKVVLITGGGSGLGRLFCIEFAKLGGVIVVWDINEDGMEETKEIVLGEVEDASIYSYFCDLSSKESIYEVHQQVVEEVGDVFCLINNAGIVSGKPFLEVDDKMIERTMQVNCLAHMWLAKKVLPNMIENNSGHIVTIASAAGTTGVAGLSDYCASKWAAIGFDESIRLELKKMGKDGVHTTCICPYYINTGMFDGVKSFPLLPILDPDYVVQQVMKAVQKKKPMLMLPFIVNFNWLLRSILPTNFYDWVVKLLGISNSMNDFKGRGDDFAYGKKKTE